MSITPESLEVGQCYLGEDRRVYRVLRLMPDGQVQYSHRPAHTPLRTWKPGMLNCGSFCRLVGCLVPCNWTPEMDQAESSHLQRRG
jgi:hypothetical protein